MCHALFYTRRHMCNDWDQRKTRKRCEGSEHFTHSSHDSGRQSAYLCVCVCVYVLPIRFPSFLLFEPAGEMGRGRPTNAVIALLEEKKAEQLRSSEHPTPYPCHVGRCGVRRCIWVRVGSRGRSMILPVNRKVVGREKKKEEMRVRVCTTNSKNDNSHGEKNSKQKQTFSKPKNTFATNRRARGKALPEHEMCVA